MSPGDGRSCPGRGGSRGIDEDTAASVARSANDLVEWAEGFSDGWREGDRHGFLDGYADGYRGGFDVGHDVGAARILLHGPVPELSPAYVDHRRRSRLDNSPCGQPRCRRCARCIRAAAVAMNRRLYGSDDHPGTGLAVAS